MAIGQQLSKGTPDGVCLGQSAADKLGFYGLATPIVQPAATNQAAPASTAVVSFAATPWGFANSAQAQALVNCVIELRAALVAVGLIKGSA